MNLIDLLYTNQAETYESVNKKPIEHDHDQQEGINPKIDQNKICYHKL